MALYTFGQWNVGGWQTAGDDIVGENIIIFIQEDVCTIRIAGGKTYNNAGIVL